MEDAEDIAFLRKQALNTLAPKGSRYGLDDVFASRGRAAFPKHPRRTKRLTTPEITREVIGAFGMKPRGKPSSYGKFRTKVAPSRKRRSASSGRSVSASSRSRSFSSYTSSKSSSRSRSRSSSSSSRSSGYSRSSSYSGSSRSSSPKREPVTPPHKRGTKRTMSYHKSHAITDSHSGRVLEQPSRKKARYAEPVPLSQRMFERETLDLHSNRRISKNSQMNEYSENLGRKRKVQRTRTSPIEEYDLYDALPPKRRRYSPDDSYHQPRRRSPEDSYHQTRRRSPEDSYHQPRRRSPEDSYHQTRRRSPEDSHHQTRRRSPDASYHQPRRHTPERYVYDSKSPYYSSPLSRPRMKAPKERAPPRNRPVPYEERRIDRRPVHVESISPPPKRRTEINMMSYPEDNYKSYREQRRTAVREQRPQHSDHSERAHRDKNRERKHSSDKVNRVKDRYIVVEDSTTTKVEKARPNSNSQEKQSKDIVEVKMSVPKSSSSDHVSKQRTVAEKKEKKEPETKTVSKTSNEPVKKADSAIKIPGEANYVEELDYNEDMDNLDLHPTGLLGEEEDDDVIENVSSRGSSAHSNTWSDGHQQESGSDVSSDRSRAASSDSDGSNVGRISSPIRVSPDRDHRKSGSRAAKESSWTGKGKMPVKQRLYISKQKIEEKKRNAVAHFQDPESPSELRPSLANRLGPPQLGHHQSRQSDEQNFSRRRPHSRQPKGSAMAIAEAFRKKKKDSAKKRVHVVKEDGQRSRTLGGKIEKSPRKLEVNVEDNELELDRKIRSIKAKNKAILKREREIENDKEKYG